MPARKKRSSHSPESKITNNRHADRQKDIPPAGLAAHGRVQEAPKARYYNRWFIPAFGFILLLLLALYARHLWEQADQNLRTELHHQAQRVSLAIHLNESGVLSGNESDLALPEYQRLKSNLMLNRQFIPESRFLYLMGQKEDGSIFFYVDSEPAGSEDESPPGQTYDEVTEPLLSAFSKAAAVVEGPMTDSWGTWVSALVPLIDPNSGEVMAVLGIDVEARRWNQLILNTVLFPLTLALLLMLFVLISVIFLIYRWKVPTRVQHRWFYRHAELCISLIFGVLVTGQLTWVAQNKEHHARQETFEGIAAARTSYIFTYLRDLENYHLGGLASFFEASEFVDRQEFLIYTSALAKDPKIQAWEWAPWVWADSLQKMEEQARQDHGFDYQVWELDEGGQKIPVRTRATYFPVLYVSPVEGNEHASGFDLGSEAIRRAALETAAQTELVTATDPITLIQETENQVGVLVFKPVLGTGEPHGQEGFILAVLRMGDLLNSALGMKTDNNPALYIDLYQMRAGSPAVFLAGNSPDEYHQAQIQSDLHDHPFADLTFIQPVYAFGKMYVLVAHPNPAFSNLFPARAGWTTIIIGITITLLAGSVIHFYSNRRYILERLVAERTEDVKKSEQKYRTLAESTSAVLWEYDIRKNRWEYISPQITMLTGWPPEEWTDLQFWVDHLYPEDQSWASKYFSECTSRGENPELEYRFLKPDGSIVWVRDVARIESLDGKAVKLRGFLIDITEKKQAEETLRLQSTALHSSANAIIITDRQGLIQWANPAFSRLTGYRTAEVLGKNPGELIKSGLHDQAFYQQLWDTILAGKTWSGEMVNRKKDGSLYQEEMTIAPVKTDKDEITHFIAIKQDISERKQREQELEAMAAISSALRTAATRADLLPIILAQLMVMFRAEGAALILREAASGEFALEAAEGEFANGFSQRFDPGMAVSGMVIETGKPFVTRDTSQERNVFQPETFKAIRAVACTPLLVEERVIGALWIGRKDEILPNDCRLLTSIADIVANAIHRETLRDETLKQLEQLASLRAIDQKLASSTEISEVLKFILEQVAIRLKVDAAAIRLFNPATLKLEFAYGHGFRTREIEATQPSDDEGLRGGVLAEHKTMCFPDLDENERVRSQLLTEEGFVSFYATPVVVKGQIKGVIEIFHRSRLELETTWINFLEILAGQIAIALDNIKLLEGLQRSNIELKEAYDATIEGWSRAMDLRDRETEGHTQRVTKITMQLARLVGMSEDEMMHVRRGALLHDIGKLGVPDSILHKPGPLDHEEWKTIHRHPQLAYDMLVPIAYLRPAIDIPLCHHEKWDGSGYPGGLKGEEIPLAARIFAIVDVFDALTTDRPYRKALLKEQAFAYVREQSGKHFDPKIVAVFFSISKEIG